MDPRINMSSEPLKGKAGRYQRLQTQLEELFAKPGDELSRMATLVAVLHHKMPSFFWTGFYLLREVESVSNLLQKEEAGADLGAKKNSEGKLEDVKERELIVGPYQGPVACQRLEPHKGVCWAGVDQATTILVPDVTKFPGHIACDARSKSEVVVPLKNRDGEIVGVLDVDSEELEAFDVVDAEWLEKLIAMVYRIDY